MQQSRRRPQSADRRILGDGESVVEIERRSDRWTVGDQSKRDEREDGVEAPRRDGYERPLGSFKVNVEPLPSVLATVRSPPIARARSRLIARPSPVPSVGREYPVSMRTNGSKMFSNLSAGIPRPVSRT